MGMPTIDQLIDKGFTLPAGLEGAIRPCPGCTEKQRIIRGLADLLATGAGQMIGTATRNRALGEVLGEIAPELIESGALKVAGSKKVKRKASEYSKKFGKAFKKVQKQFKKKDGCWKKGGYRRCVVRAHKMAKK